MLLQIDWSRMFAEHVGVHNLHSCLREIEQTLRNTLSKCGFSPEADTFIMPVVHTRHTTIAISFERRKTPEKNGAT
jgi:hypothetical protein